MKESKLIEMWNRIELLGSNQQQIIAELKNLKDLSIGTMTLLKKFPDYENAIEKLTKEAKENMNNKETKLEDVE
jgi:predicted ATP-grasp superfamily ATP-dependent carboligase